jgi:hypothetical protein
MNMQQSHAVRLFMMLLAGTVSVAVFSTNAQAEPIPAVELNSTKTVEDTVKILSPAPNAVLDVPAATIIIQFLQDSEAVLSVNGTPADRSLIGRTETDAKNNLVTQTWYGVSLKEGVNTITAQPKNGPPVTLSVQVRGMPKQLTVKIQQAKILADGRSTTTVEGQFLDAQGNRSNRDAIITLTSSAGEFVGADAEPDQPGFQVQARQGQYTTNLRSSLASQMVRVQAVSADLEASTQLEFQTSLRPSLVTGVVNLRLGPKGTDYYRSFREFLPPDKNNGTQLDLRTAVFATGKLGDWLLTGAYNNIRALNQDCNDSTRLFQDVQACDQQYPVYGDSSTSERTAQSQDSLFFRLERNQDYAMWGDYSTQKEFAVPSQQFTAVTRQLHGLKLNYNFGNLQTTGFYGDNVQSFQRDTITPDGTSGYYFLSQRLLLAGSENISTELEELNRPGTVIERKALLRGTDYEIDYDRGTVLFRKPFFQTEIDKNGQLLVRRIVVTYEHTGNNTVSNIYGGRLQYHFSKELNRESWLGATYLRENQGVRHFELYGTDAQVSLGPNAKLIAEYAHSLNDSEVLGAVSGSAYRLEAEGNVSPDVRARAYLRSADTGFANNATTSFVAGQTRYGAEITAKVGPTTNLKAQYDHEDNHGVTPQPRTTFNDLFNPGATFTAGNLVDSSLTTLSVGVQQQLGSSNLEVDWLNRLREDRTLASLAGSSSQLRSRLTVPLSEKLTFLAQNELNLAPRQDANYPDRTTLGLQWAVYPGIKVQLSQQFFSGGQYGSNSVTSLETLADYKLGEDTTLTGRYSVIGGASGLANQGALGLNQRWVIAPGFTTNFNYEHIVGDVFANTTAGGQFAQPYGIGQGASSLGIQGGDSYGVGFEYTENPDFKASARYEHRTSSGGANTVLSAAATGKLSPSLTALLRYNQASSSNQLLTGLGDTSSLKLGLAYRDPKDTRFNALLRYEYRQNPGTIPNTILLGSGTGSADHTLAMEAIYAPNAWWEFYGKYALRSSTTYLAQDFSASSLISLAQLRAKYRLGYNTDIVGEIRSINQPSTGYSEIGGVAELGYYLSPNLRLAAGYSFGRATDRDFSGGRFAEGAYLGITLKVNELFDGFGLQQVAPAQQQESQLAKTTLPSAAPPNVTAEPAPISLAPAAAPRKDQAAALPLTQVQQKDLAKAEEKSSQTPVLSQTAAPAYLKDLQPLSTSAEVLSTPIPDQP